MRLRGGMSNLCRQWQRHMTDGSRTSLALQPDPPAVPIHNRAGDIQPNAQSRIGSTNIAAPKEALENALLLALGNTNTRIADCELRQGCSIISA